MKSLVPSAGERECALMQLFQDPIYDRIEEEGLPAFVDACIACGRREANGIRGVDPERALADTGYVLRRVSGAAPGSRVGYHLCAMTRASSLGGESGTVDLYVDEVAFKREGLTAFGFEAGQEELERLHLLHELYHVIEFSSCPTVDKVPRVDVRGLFGRKPRGLASSSELAAHAFAHAMMPDLPQPFLVDAMALMGEGAMTRGRFESDLAKARRILNERL